MFVTMFATIKIPIKQQKLARNAYYLILNSIHKSYMSSLYITNDRGREMYAAVNPHIDLPEKLEDLPKLKRMLELRGVSMNVDKIKNLYEFMKTVESARNALNEKVEEIRESMSSLRDKTDEESVAELEKWNIQYGITRADKKMLSNHICDLEKQTILKGLTLPNYLHDDTPHIDPKVIHEFGVKAVSNGKSHIEMGTKLDLLDFRGPSCYYLKNKAALFEMSILYTFGDKLLNENFIQQSNPDFGWSVAVEGCGLDHRDPNVTFILEDEEGEGESCEDHKLHLVGGSSLVSLCSYHAKNIFIDPDFPLKYFTIGRAYKPKINLKTSDCGANLFNAWQSSVVEYLILTSENYDEMMCVFQRFLNQVVSIYEELGLHFRVVYVPAKSLLPYESLRAGVEMYSPHMDSYIEVGNISISDDYISKRLLMCYNSGGDNERHFVRVLSGTLFSLPKFLGCVLEYDNPINILENVSEKLCDFVSVK